MGSRHEPLYCLQFRDAKGIAIRLASNAPKNTAANEGERSERQNAVPRGSALSDGDP
jgi:hypothetical protein